jgi:uncharacterized paraquat-inducible protein A
MKKPRRSSTAAIPGLVPNRFQGLLARVKTTGVVQTTALLGTFSRSSRCALQADRGSQSHETESMHKEFACPVCDSPAIVYPDEGEEDRVVCGRCGAFLATRNQFRRFVEEHAEVQTTGW